MSHTTEAVRPHHHPDQHVDLDPTSSDHVPAGLLKGRGWAVCGVGAAVFAAVGMGARVVLVPAYNPAVSGDATKVAALIVEHKLALSAFHVAGAAAAMLLIPFAAGLLRRLRDAMGPASLAPTVAGFGVLVTAMVLVMGTALDTEFGIFVPPPDMVPAEHVSFYGHWTGTVPDVWIAIGLAGLAVFVAWRRGAVSRAQGVTGLVLGGLAVVIGISPLQYIALLPGILWLLIASAMFLFGDKAHRAR